jgi:hypothetical protein
MYFPGEGDFPHRDNRLFYVAQSMLLGGLVTEALLDQAADAIDSLTQGINHFIDGLDSADESGAIGTNGSPNVFINGKPAARAALAADDNTVK